MTKATYKKHLLRIDELLQVVNNTTPVDNPIILPNNQTTA